MKLGRMLLAALLAFSLSGAPAFAQVLSNQSSVQLTMTVGESLTVTGAPPSVSFTYNPNGTATASGTISVTTTWSLAAGHPELDTYVYFASATAALTGPSSIPSSDVFASIDGGAVQPCTFSGPFGAAGANCFPALKVTNPPVTGNSTDTVLLSLSGLGTLNAGTYTGTLFIQADAN